MGYTARDNYNYGARWFVRDLDSGEGSQEIRMDSDADFAVEKIAYTYTYTGDATDDNGRLIGGFQVRIKDSTTGRYWDNDWIAIDTIGGPATLPFVLPVPKIMVANSIISILLRADNAPNVDDDPNFVFILNFLGDKLFRG